MLFDVAKLIEKPGVRAFPYFIPHRTRSRVPIRGENINLIVETEERHGQLAKANTPAAEVFECRLLNSLSGSIATGDEPPCA